MRLLVTRTIFSALEIRLISTRVAVYGYNPNTGLEYYPLTLNRYAYTKNSPLNYMDPSGHSAIGLTNRLMNVKGSLKNKIRSSIETQSSIEIIPGVLSISMQEAIAMGEMTDCDLDEMASGILGMITELSYYMGYLGLGLLMPRVIIQERQV